MVTTVVLGETITDGALSLKVREYRSVWFPSKSKSERAVTLKHLVLTTLLNSPRRDVATETSDASMEREGVHGEEFECISNRSITTRCLSYMKGNYIGQKVMMKV